MTGAPQPAPCDASATDARTRYRRLRLAGRPGADGDLARCFRADEAWLPAPGEGEVLLRNDWLSIDICARGRMDPDPADGDGIALGEVMPCATVASVHASRHPAFRSGDVVLAHSGWQTHAMVHGSQLKRKLHANVAPATTALGVYGLYGFIAWSAIEETGRPRAGDTMVVAGAAGPIGATAGQLAKAAGARVVGVTSGARKCAHVVGRYGFDVAVDRLSPDFADTLRATCPDGIDIFLESVHGESIDIALPLLNDDARMPLCGIMEGSAWPLAQGDRLPAFLNAILVRRLEVRSFTRRDITRLHPQFLVDPAFLSAIGRSLREGTLRYDEDVVDGLEQAPAALARLVRGDNFGKLLVRL